MSIAAAKDNASIHTLENRAGTRLVLTETGASVVSLVYRGTDIVLGWEDPEKYGTNPGSLGATIGRCANRIGGAHFSLNGKEYALAANNGPNNLHSGPNGWKLRRWEIVDEENTSLTFRLDSPDGDQGFPGKLSVTVTYALGEDDEIRILYRAISDADTLFNVTNHAYFNLNGHDAGSAMAHSLRVFADAYTPGDAEQIPTGEIAPVEGTPFDFQKERVIGDRIDQTHPQLDAAGGYDHNYCLNGDGLRPAARLRGDRTGIVLTVFTDRPGMQLYTANSLRADGGKDGAVYSPRSAVCLETQCWPDAIHHENFPTPILKAGEVFVTETVWRLEHS